MIGIRNRILYVIGSLEAGGTERHLLLLTKGLIKKGFQCAVVTLEGEGKLTKLFKSSGVKVFEFGLQKKGLYSAPWKIFTFLLYLLSVIRKWKPDIIHAYLPLVTMIGAIAGKLCRVPFVIISKRGLSTHQRRVPILKYCDIIADLLSDKILVNSLAVKIDTLKYSPVSSSKVEIIYNGIEPPDSIPERAEAREKLGLSKQIKVITCVANLIEYKGLRDLIMAAAIINKKRPDVRFILVGEDRGIGQELKTLASNLGISDIICFCGHQKDVWKILAASDVYVHPSYEEGFSNAILEAMAVGLPVVATNVGGNPEAVFDGITGFLVAPRSPNELAEAVLKLLTMEDTGKSMGAEGRQIVLSKFSAKAMVENYLQFYQNLGRERQHVQ